MSVLAEIAGLVAKETGGVTAVVLVGVLIELHRIASAVGDKADKSRVSKLAERINRLERKHMKRGGKADE